MGARPTRRFAPAGSNRSRHGPDGNSLDQAILGDLEKLSLYAEAPLPLLQVALAQLESVGSFGSSTNQTMGPGQSRLKG